MVDGQLLNIYLENSLMHTFGAISIHSSDVNASEVSVSFGESEAGGGWAFTFTSNEGALAVQVSASPLNKNTNVRGLMGNFDGLRDNDLMRPNNTIIPSNSTLEEIHWQYGTHYLTCATYNKFIELELVQNARLAQYFLSN